MAGQREIAVAGVALTGPHLLPLLLRRERCRTGRPPSLDRIVLLNHVAKIVISITQTAAVIATTSAEHRRRVVGRQGRLRENAQRADDGDEATLFVHIVRRRRADERVHRRLPRRLLIANPRQLVHAALIVHYAGRLGL